MLPFTKKSLEPLVANSQKYCAGNLYWQIEKEQKFKWIALLYMLNKAKDRTGKQAASSTDLYKMTEYTDYNLRKQFHKYEAIAQRYQKMKGVGYKKEKSEKLTEKILEVWSEDITKGSLTVAKKLIEKGVSKTITKQTVCSHVRNIDFIEFRNMIAKNWQKGNYSFSTQWVLQKYQDTIDKLLSKLEQEGIWSKALIERSRGELPQVPLDKLPNNNSPQPHSNRAWLKCFLFNLPKSLGGKICCPSCGSFQTSCKSKIPQPKIVVNPKTSKQECVHIFRFYCQNNNCSAKTFLSSICKLQQYNWTLLTWILLFYKTANYFSNVFTLPAQQCPYIKANQSTVTPCPALQRLFKPS